VCAYAAPLTRQQVIHREKNANEIFPTLLTRALPPEMELAADLRRPPANQTQ
jgi:hypothetical protein